MDPTSKELQAFVSLLLEHQSALRAYVVSMMPGSDDAEDVLQNTNVIIWEKMHDYEEGTNFQAWVFNIARKVVKTQFRANKRNRLPSVDDDLMQAIDMVWHNRGSQEILNKQRALDRCLEKLKQADRELIAARYTKGNNLEMHARKIGRPADSLRTSISRVRAKLRVCVQQRLSMEGGVS